jgi:hypothetical protein
VLFCPSFSRKIDGGRQEKSLLPKFLQSIFNLDFICLQSACPELYQFMGPGESEGRQKWKAFRGSYALRLQFNYF